MEANNENRNWSAYEWDSHIGNTAPMRPVAPRANPGSQAPGDAPYQAPTYQAPVYQAPVYRAPVAPGYDSYDDFFYGPGTEAPAKRRRGCGCGCGCFPLISLVLVVALVATMWPTLLPSTDILRGAQIDQVRDWLSDNLGFDWQMPSQEEFEAIYNQETRADAGYLSDEPSTDLVSVADALHYYRNTLDGHAQSVYDAIEEGVLAQETRINVPLGTTEAELQTCWQFVLYDHPGLFNLPDDAHVSYWSVAGAITHLEPDYKYDARTTAELSAQFEQLAQDLPLLAGTQAETMENICAYVADTTEYGNTGNDQYIDSVFVDRESVCAGYAKAVQYLALRHGIPCVYITGTAEDYLGTGGNHAWLAACIDGEVRYYDPTWYDQRGFHATQFLDMNLVEISQDHTAAYPQLLPR